MMLDELFDRNVNWALAKTEDDPGFFRRLAEQQSPRYLWVGCSDSRVPANDIVGLDPGEIFVHRNIANVFHTSDLNLLSVLEFAVEALKIDHIIVCGHYGCGGVKRALEGSTGNLVDHWLAPIVDLHNRHRSEIEALPELDARLDRMCELNVALQMRRIAASPIVKAAWAEGRAIRVHGWIYGLHDGLLRDLGRSVGSIDELAALPPMDTMLDHAIEPMTALRRHAIEAFADLVAFEPPEGLEYQDPQCCDRYSLAASSSRKGDT